MTDIELRNENGKIVGYNTETGEKVPVKFQELGAERIINTPIQENQWDEGKRSLVTTEDIELFVDPVNGDDSNDGSSTNPLQTLQEAANRVPYFQNHDVVITLRSGTYGTGKFPPIISTAKPNNDKSFKIRPDSGLGPSDITISKTLQVSVIDGEPDQATVSDITIGGTVLQKVGNVTYKNCVFDASGSPLSMPDGTGDIAFNAHADCRVELNNCDFGANNYGTGALISKGCQLELNSCTGVLSKYVAEVNRGATLVDTNNGVYGELGYISPGNGGALRHRDGTYAHNKVALSDDFADGQLTDRALHESRAGFYPEWKTIVGSPSATSGALVFPSGSKHIVSPGVRQADGSITTFRISRMMTGTWRWDYQFQVTPSSSYFAVRPIVDDNDNLWRIKVFADGTVNLEKADSGSVSTVVSGSWSVDTASHTIKFVRSKDIDGNGNIGVELIVDGTSQGTATDTFVPQPDLRDIRYYSMDADLHIQTVRETREEGTYR